MTSILQSVRPRCEKMMGEKRGDDGEITKWEKRFSSAHVGSFTTSVQEVMDAMFQMP